MREHVCEVGPEFPWMLDPNVAQETLTDKLSEIFKWRIADYIWHSAQGFVDWDKCHPRAQNMMFGMVSKFSAYNCQQY